MDFPQIIKPFTRIFHLLGLSPCQAGLPTSTKKCVRSDIIAYCWFGFSLYLAISYYYGNANDPTALARSKMEILATDLDLIFELFRAASVLIQCIFYKQHFHDINHNFQKIEAHFRTQFQHILPYRSLKTRFYIKASIICAAYFQFFVGHVLRVIKYYNGYVNNQLRTLQALTLLTFIHIILYIEALSFHLDQLNIVIKRDMLQRAASSSSSVSDKLRFHSQLKSVKFIYFGLWLAAQHINKVFSWVLVALSLYTFFDLVVCAFCFYEVINIGADFPMAFSTLFLLSLVLSFDRIKHTKNVSAFILGPISRSLIVVVSLITLVHSCQSLKQKVNLKYPRMSSI